VAVWTVAQTAQFLSAIKNHRMYAAFHLIALRGLRRGEAAGLRWCDVDLDEGVAVICQQLQQRNGQIVAGPPKTPHSMRVIALDRSTVAALRAHKERQRAERTATETGTATADTSSPTATGTRSPRAGSLISSSG
jgi:integrase